MNLPSSRSNWTAAKLTVAGLCGLIAAAIPLTGFYLLWSYCIAQVPLVSAYAGLIKIAVTLALVLVGGGFTLVLAFWGAVFVGAWVAAILFN